MAKGPRPHPHACGHRVHLRSDGGRQPVRSPAGRCAGMDEEQEPHSLLSASATFGALDDSVRASLAAAMHRERVAPGTALLRQGHTCDALFVVARGQLEVRLRRDDGSDVLIDTVGRGEVIGEMQLVVGGAASASVVALSECLVFSLQRDDFDALCASAPALPDTLTRIAARRLQRRQMLAVLPAMFGALDTAE